VKITKQKLPCGCPKNWKCDCKEVTCSNPDCGKKFWQNGYSKLSDHILKHKPVCSFECGKALGQIK
jgi:hypothetical protein